MRRTLGLSLGLLLSAAGCDDATTSAAVDAGRPDGATSDGGGADGGAPDGAVVVYETPPLPDYDALPFPRATDGRVLLTANNGFSLYTRPDEVSPGARLGRCTYTVVACLKGAGQGDVDACLRSAPVCADPAYADPATPPCCPAACVSAYAQARAQGAAPLAALDATLFADASCVPGLTEALAGEGE
ncbi:MAG: hypothetical protein KC613_01935 [Myxococcales bacterium]|nr:hypothetical protein [Myxococcales bacterium]